MKIKNTTADVDADNRLFCVALCLLRHVSYQFHRSGHLKASKIPTHFSLSFLVQKLFA